MESTLMRRPYVSWRPGRARCPRPPRAGVLALARRLAGVALLIGGAIAPPSGAQPRTGNAGSYDPAQAVRFGNAAAFRHLISPSMLEQQASGEYRQWVHSAQQRGQLLPDGDPQVKRVRAILQRLIPYALKWNERAKRWQWEAYVVRSPHMMIRCLPGGKLLINSALLTRLRPNDNELAMLMGHMVAHALREHARERLGRQQATQLGAGTIPQLFGLADLGSTPLDIGTHLAHLRYDAADETEADVIGDEIASRAGFDPRAALTVWSRAAALPGASKTSFIAAHPMTPQRAADLRKRLSDMLPLYAKALGTTTDALPRYRHNR
ncbi:MULTISPECIES: M48 family metallopeptidase [Burkholderiaceae]|uniref:M48 family metallopeptidase n=1 Tax=Burkholderiaceae TaxID=119060 RepID=UPI001F1DEFD9|nr:MULTISPECIES: M48 family metallopeptidase [Burkholderiaceae]